MQNQKTETPRLGPRIQSWIDAIEPGTPEVTNPNNTRKRPRQQQDNNPRPTKRTTRRALASATGNIMAPPTQPPNRPPDDILRRSERIVAKTPQKSTNRGTQANDEVQEEDTPTPGRSRQDGMPYLGRQGTYPILVPTGAVDGMNARSSGQSSPSRTSKSSNDRTQSTEEKSVGGTSSNAGSTKRSQSPKKMVDFRTAQKRITVERLDGNSAAQAGGVLDRYRDLVRLRSGKGVIPCSLRTIIEENTHVDDWPDEDWYSRAAYDPYEEKIGVKVLEIWQQAWRLEERELSEPEWNRYVHGPLLDLVVDNPKYHRTMVCADITKARINPKSLSMYQLSGSKLQDKMVDYAIVLECRGDDEDKITNMLRDMPWEEQSVNQSTMTSVRFGPICLNSETKIPFTGGPEADVQLTTWASAGLVKLRRMLVENDHADEHIPTMPLLSFHGHQVHLTALHEGRTQNRYLEKLYLGSTSTLPSMFQLLKALDILVEWGNTEYRAWWFSKVAKAE